MVGWLPPGLGWLPPGLVAHRQLLRSTEMNGLFGAPPGVSEFEVPSKMKKEDRLCRANRSEVLQSQACGHVSLQQHQRKLQLVLAGEKVSRT